MSLLGQAIAMLKARRDAFHPMRTHGRRAVLQLVDHPVRITAVAGDADSGEVGTLRASAASFMIIASS